MRILIADDHDPYREAFAAFLRDIDQVDCVTTAASLPAAVAAIRTEGPFDLALLDEALPGLDSPTVLAEIRAANRGHPVALLSANPTADALQEPQAVAVIAKPRGVRSMVDAIARVAAGEGPASVTGAALTREPLAVG